MPVGFFTRQGATAAVWSVSIDSCSGPLFFGRIVCIRPKRLRLIISHKPVISRPLGEKRHRRRFGGPRFRRLEKQLTFTVAGEKHKEKIFTKRKSPWT